MKHIGRIALIGLVVILTTGPALAQDEDPGTSGGSSTTQTLSRFGLRAGYTDWKEVSQFHFGLHYLAGEVMPNIEFTPNVEVGLGDGATVIAVQADVAYQFTELVQRPWGLYGGGCLAFNYVDHDLGGSDTDLGLSLLAGGKYNFSSGRQAMLEVRVGIMDSPSLKVTLGTTIF